MVKIVQNKHRLDQIIEHPFLDINKGKFILIEGKNFVCCDNSSGHAWTEEFTDIILAVKWLNNHFEVFDMLKRTKHKRIELSSS